MADPTPEALTDLVTPVVVRVAATIGLLEQVVRAPAPADELAGRLGVDPDVVTRLARFLAVRGIFTADTRGVVRATQVGRALFDRQSGSYTARLDWLGAAGRLDRMFVAECLAAMRGERTRGDLWDELDQDADFARSFDELMTTRADEWAGVLVTHAMWRDVRHVADVGGGRGHLLVRLLDTWPHLRGTLVERAGPARAATAEIARRSLDDRADVVVADFRDEIPACCDVYLLAHVLHDWDDATAACILRRTAAAAGPHGRVVVVERVLTRQGGGERRAQLEATAQDLRLFVLFGGRERTLAQFGGLARRSGLVLRRRGRLTAGRSLLVFDATGKASAGRTDG